MEHNEESTPLLKTAEVEDGQEVKAAPTDIEDEPPIYSCLFDPYDPVTKHCKAKLPGPTYLLGLFMGMTFVEVFGIFGAYMYLVTHARILFPRCSEHDMFHFYFGVHSYGYVCEGTSWLLWTFPLFCCALIPFLNYWEFCDHRLFYECLREKVMIKFPEKRFFSAPIIIIMVIWLVLGLATLFVGGHPGTDVKAWTRFVVVLIPFMLPVASFAVTVFLTWDIKFFLITLSNYAAEDFAWASKHLVDSTCVTDEDVQEAVERLMRGGCFPRKANSREVFGVLADELMKPESTPSVINASDADTRRWIANSWQRALAVVFFRKGFWMTDLLWLPRDTRALQYRIAFRLFATGVWLVLALCIYLFIITTVLFMETQGRLDEGNLPAGALWLREFMISAV